MSCGLECLDFFTNKLVGYFCRWSTVHIFPHSPTKEVDELRSRYDALQRSVCDLTAQFLATERVVELSSGQPLKRCFLVRVNNELRVEEVVMEGKVQTSA